MSTNELYHHGVLGMKWGRRKAKEQSTASTGATQKQQNHAASNSYSKALNRNALVTVNRVSQMGITLGLTKVASIIAKKRGKKATAGALSAIGTMAAAGLGAGLIVDLARNNVDRGD